MENNESENKVLVTAPTINNNESENKYDSTIITTKKFTSNKWNMIEKPLSDAERKRNEIILKLGEEIISTSEQIYKTNIFTIGDYYYRILKNELSKLLNFEHNFDNEKKSNKEFTESNKFNKFNKFNKNWCHFGNEFNRPGAVLIRR